MPQYNSSIKCTSIATYENYNSIALRGQDPNNKLVYKYIKAITEINKVTGQL